MHAPASQHHHSTAPKRERSLSSVAVCRDNRHYFGSDWGSPKRVGAIIACWCWLTLLQHTLLTFFSSPCLYSEFCLAGSRWTYATRFGYFHFVCIFMDSVLSCWNL